LVLALLSASTAEAGRCVGVFFRGFGAAVGTSGMDNLEDSLFSAFGGDPARPFSTGVFNWTDQQQAFDFVQGLTDIDCLVLAGHSFGANSAVEFTTDFLEPAGIPVDRLFLFDSVGASDDVLPTSVVRGFNYHQVSTGFAEPEGVSNVEGATNIYVEEDYGVSDGDISHTQIDCPLFERSEAGYAALFGSQPDLYARVEIELAPLFDMTPVPSSPWPGTVALIATLVAIGASALHAGRRRREA
jgi:pimeloyl-ACP methyl ester carboxylesterase